jgi:hypothetical protein
VHPEVIERAIEATGRRPTMTETTTQAPATNETEPTSSLVDTLFDLGTSWATVGLKAGKAALEQSAKALEATARALNDVAVELEKK